MTMQPVRPRRTWDLVLTIVLLVLHIALALVASLIGVFLVFISDSCGAVVCDSDQIANGIMLGIIGPPILAVVVVIVAIVLLVLRQIAFWVPIVGSVLMLVLEVTAFYIAASGVAGFLTDFF